MRNRLAVLPPVAPLEHDRPDARQIEGGFGPSPNRLSISASQME
jgi:hypothetical protein